MFVRWVAVSGFWWFRVLRSRTCRRSQALDSYIPSIYIHEKTLQRQFNAHGFDCTRQLFGLFGGFSFQLRRLLGSIRASLKGS